MTSEEIILSQSEYEALLEEIHRLQARISELTALRDDLVYHICPALQAEYEEKIASLERELLAAEMYLRENQRILEILQAQMNQQKKPSYEEAKKKAREEFLGYEEDLKRKAKEAEDFKQRWEKESRWSEHDRKEKEEKQKQKTQQKTAQDRADYSKNKKSRPEGAETGSDGLSEKDESGRKQDHGRSDGKSKRGRPGYRTDRIGIDEEDYDEDDPEQEATSDGEEGDSSDESDDGNTPAKRLKRLYRRIVKRLHPDVHPDSTPREKELFNMAQGAMKSGDLDKMERIYDELSGMDTPEEKFEDTPEGIASLKDLIRKLRERLRRLQTEIAQIRSQFPYTMKAFLEDEQAVEEKRHELQEKLRNLREANEKLADFIKKIKQQMGI